MVNCLAVGNCNDNLAGYPPVGVKSDALCMFFQCLK